MSIARRIATTARLEGPTGGRVTSSAQEVQSDGAITLTATPDDGYRFVRWEGDTSGNKNPITITPSSHIFVTAVFDLATPTQQPQTTQRVRLFTSRVLSAQTWQIGQPVDLTLPAATERPGFYNYSIKYEWNHDQTWEPAGVRFDRNLRRFSGAPSMLLNPNPALRQFTVFLRAEDRLREGEWDELLFVVLLEPAPSNPDTVSAPDPQQPGAQPPADNINGDTDPEDNQQPKQTTTPATTTGPQRAPGHQQSVKIRTRYHKNQGHNATVEVRLLEIRQGKEHEIMHRRARDRYIANNILVANRGHWVHMKECLPVSNWNCVTPMVRLREGHYEFAIGQLTDKGRRIPTGALFPQTSFQRNDWWDKIDHPWEKTGSITIHSIRDRRLYDLGTESAGSALNKSLTQHEMLSAFDRDDVRRAREYLKTVRSRLDDLKSGNDAIARFVQYTFKYQDELGLVIDLATGNWHAVILGALNAAGQEIAGGRIDGVSVENKADAEEVARKLKKVLDQVQSFAHSLAGAERLVDTWEGFKGSILSAEDADIVRSAYEMLFDMPSRSKIDSAINTVAELKQFVEFREFTSDLLSAVSLTGAVKVFDLCARHPDDVEYCEELLRKNRVGLEYRGNELSEAARRAVDSLNFPTWKISFHARD